MKKAEKIKAEIDRRLRTIEPNLPSREDFDKVADRNPGINSDFNIGEKMGAYTMLKKVEQFIDSLEQPIKRTPADIEAAMQEVEEKSKLFTEAHKDDVVSNDPISNPLEISRHGDSHIGETLEEAARKAATWHSRVEGDKFFPNDYQKFIAGAQWQKKHLFDNRIKDCNNITEDQYNLESDFLDDFIDKHDRMPTFLDAIEYGMKLQKEQDQSTIELAEDHAMLAGMDKMRQEMMKNVVLETKVMKDNDGDGIDTPYEEWLTLEDTEIPFIPNNIGLKDGDKVKLIIIREE